jgi:S1-C subfamily serine protease
MTTTQTKTTITDTQWRELMRYIEAGIRINRYVFFSFLLSIVLLLAFSSSKIIAAETEVPSVPLVSTATPESPAPCPSTEVGKLLGVEVFQGHGQTKDGKPGVDVIKVIPKGPSAKAGLKAGDVITTVNGKAVNCPMTLLMELNGSDAAKKIVFSLDRKGKKKSITYAPKTLNIKSTKPVEAQSEPPKPEVTPPQQGK